MNPHPPHSTSLISLARNTWLNRELIKKMAWREIVGRYKGSMLGLLWSLITPLIMLTVYTFFFSVVFKMRWGGSNEESNYSFALVLFVGLIIHGLLAEVLNHSPKLIVSNVNYVKKVVFPLEILPITTLLAALFHCLVSLCILLIAFIFIYGYIPWTILFVPVVLLPLIILILGLSWLLTSLGVFIRDIGHTINLITTVMLFLAPVFYPLTAMPDKYQPFILANPITFIIEQSREIILFGNPPNWFGLGIYMLVATFIAWIGFYCFQKTRTGFADVL